MLDATLSGIASVAFAFFVIFRPTVGALAMIWVIGWYALLLGAMLVALSFKLRGFGRRTEVIEPQHRRAA